MTPITGHTQVFGLVGHPVRHSLSPALYNSLFAKFDIDAVYVAFDVNPDEAERVADLVRTMGLVGVNLTVPFKERIIDELDGLTAAAEKSGAVNVVAQIDGSLMGHNTDGEGFIRSLKEEDGPSPADMHALILGAGGAARAVAFSLLDHGASKITFLNRTKSRAVRAADSLKSVFPNSLFDVRSLDSDAFADAAASAQLVVNCTTGPAYDVVADLRLDTLVPTASWVDINYWMANPPAQSACNERGIRFHDGLGMLAHQGALAFELFTGHPVTGTEVRRFLEQST